MSDGSERDRQAQRQHPLAQPVPEFMRPDRLTNVHPVDLGEQIVGSQHEFEVPPPQNLSDSAAVGEVSINGAPDITVAWPGCAMIPSVPGGPLKFTYTPKAAGSHRATLVLVVRWTDGHVETRHVEVTARARSLEALPADAPQSSGKKMKEPLESKQPDRGLGTDSFAGWQNVATAHEFLISQQKEGVQVISEEAGKFKLKPAERTLWQDLAEFAFQLGTAAIAGYIGKWVTARVSKFLWAAEAAGKVADAGTQEIAALEQRRRQSTVFEGEFQRQVTAKRVDNFAKEDHARHTKVAEAEISSQVGSAVSRAFTTAANVARGPQAAGGGAGATVESNDDQEQAAQVSEDKTINFFSVQRSMIAFAGTQGALYLNSVLQEQIKRDPEFAGDLMAGVKDGLMGAANDAVKPQADATGQAFVTYRARLGLGTKSFKTSTGNRTVTDLSSQRSLENPVQTPSLANGVLEIVANHDTHSGSASVEAARLQGISHLIANRLTTVPLASSGLPMRVSLYGGLTIITRDEAGRVRLSGAPLKLQGPSSETQQLRYAEQILRQVFSKTLSEWGVESVETNDATQPAASTAGTHG